MCWVIHSCKCFPLKNRDVSILSFRYNIFPDNDINFGSMLVNSRKTRTFTIENRGDKFEFKYTITKMIREKAEDARRSRQ